MGIETASWRALKSDLFYSTLKRPFSLRNYYSKENANNAPPPEKTCYHLQPTKILMCKQKPIIRITLAGQQWESGRSKKETLCLSKATKHHTKQATRVIKKGFKKALFYCLNITSKHYLLGQSLLHNPITQQQNHNSSVWEWLNASWGMRYV